MRGTIGLMRRDRVVCWAQVRGLTGALQLTVSRVTTEAALEVPYMRDDQLADLEAKARGLAEALHDIRLLQRYTT